MESGIQVFSDVTNRPLFDDKASLLILVKKQTFTNMPMGTFDFVVNGIIAPTIAYTSNQYLQQPKFQSISGNNLTYRFTVDIANTTVTVYAFDFTRVKSQSNYGLQTFDENNNLLYDAVAGKYLKPVNYIPIQYPYAAGQVLATIPPGKVYAAAVAGDSMYIQINEALGASYIPSTRISGNQVLGSAGFKLQGSGPFLEINVPGGWLIIDVTGL